MSVRSKGWCEGVYGRQREALESKLAQAPVIPEPSTDTHQSARVDDVGAKQPAAKSTVTEKPSQPNNIDETAKPAKRDPQSIRVCDRGVSVVC